jgi:hypothetical protein
MQFQAFFLAVLLAGADPVEVAQIDVGQAKQVEITSQEISEKGTELTVVLKPKDQQFSVDFNWDQTDFRRVKILVKGCKAWDTVRYFPTVKHGKQHFFNLLTLRGVDVDHSGNDCLIQFLTPSSLKLLPPSGRLVFRFQSGAALHLNSGPGGVKATPK